MAAVQKSAVAAQHVKVTSRVHLDGCQTEERNLLLHKTNASEQNLRELLTLNFHASQRWAVPQTWAQTAPPPVASGREDLLEKELHFAT